MTRIAIDMARKLEGMKSDLQRAEKIVAAGGFRDADGDWIAVNVDRKTSEIARLREMIAETEREAVSAERELDRE